MKLSPTGDKILPPKRVHRIINCNNVYGIIGYFIDFSITNKNRKNKVTKNPESTRGLTSRSIPKIFNENPEVDVVYGRLDRIDESGKVVPTPTLPKDKVEFSKKLVIGECVVNQPGSFWRSRMMDLVGLLDERLIYGLDFEYWIRMAMAGAKFKRINDTVAQFRLSKSSKTVGQSAEMAEEQLAILDRLLLDDNLPEILGLSNSKIKSDARKAKSVASLYAFKGYLQQNKFNKAWSHLLNALYMYPFVIINRRWYDLAIASLMRRLKN